MIIIALVSGAFALYRHRLQVRKDRVDTFFDRLLEIRETMADSTADPAASRARVLAVQREVLQLLINEKIAADASLVTFMSQSNQMLAELDQRTR